MAFPWRLFFAIVGLSIIENIAYLLPGLEDRYGRVFPILVWLFLITRGDRTKFYFAWKYRRNCYYLKICPNRFCINHSELLVHPEQI